MGFIDRLLLAANMYAIDVAIVYNKKDMLREKDFERFDEIAAIYRKMDYPVHLVSAETKEGLAEISQLIEGKTVIFAGHSGVGKSTIVNQLIPGLDIKTNIISKFTSKGQHTTTVADMYDINVNTRMIDTPGIKEFAAVHIEPGELAGYFKDFVPYLENCKFSNCRHENEPNCAIKDAVVEGEITESRFMNYLKLLEEIDKPHYL
ncbi:UNVERIFIED_CONTAM: hypothetical protein GTU68_000008 [Idotea baltica]|nr:hypothetical protein [Idotea baltica]